MKKNPKKGNGASPDLLLFRVLLSDPSRRPVAIRYLLDLASVVLVLIAAVLPTVSFRTKGGESDPHSFFYWLRAAFFGVDGTKGAYESLLNASVGNQSLVFYRTVVVTCIVAVILLVLGILVTALTAIGALYLLSTEESTDLGKRIGRLYRVVFGDRFATLLPSLVFLLPFIFTRLLAYYYTALLSSDSVVVLTPIDPLVLAGLTFALRLFVLLFVKERERKLKYDIFRSPARRVTAADLRRHEEEAWEEEVRRDAIREEMPLRTKRTEKCDPVKDEKKTEKVSEKREKDDESLYGRRFVVGKRRASVLPIKEKTAESARPSTDSEKSEVKETLLRLFDEDDGAKS